MTELIPVFQLGAVLAAFVGWLCYRIWRSGSRVAKAMLWRVPFVGALAVVASFPSCQFRGTIADRIGGFSIVSHRLLEFDPLFPRNAWRLRHSSSTLQRLLDQ